MEQAAVLTLKEHINGYKNKTTGRKKNRVKI